MGSLKSVRVLAVSSLAVCLAAPARGAAPPPQPVATSSIAIEGDSTLHRFALRATRIDVRFDRTSPATGRLAERARAGQLGPVDVEVAQGAFTSGEGDLDANFRKALRAVQQPFLRFHLASYEVAAAGPDASFGLVLHGTASAAGVEVPVDVTAQVFVLPDDSLRVKGVLPLRMTDFKVKPPVLMLGAIRCKDAVTVRFDLVLREPAAK